MKYIKRSDGKFAGSYPKGTVAIHHNYKHGNPVEYWNPKQKKTMQKTSIVSKIKSGISWLVRATLKLTLYTAALAAIVLIIGLSFRAAFPHYVKAVETVEIEAAAPVLDRIAQCESHNSHTCTDALIKVGLCSASEKGQVVVNANGNKTVDVGKYQINLYYWGAKASAMSINLFEEEGNERMAKWIYANYGTGDWSASAKCWKK